FNRVNLLMAVLEKRGRMNLSECDAYVNIAGGIKMTEPAIDLAILLAVASSYRDIVIPDRVVAFGEVGLSGEVRAVSMAQQRVREAKKLGFETVILPRVCENTVGEAEGVELVFVSTIAEAVEAIR
ncbi:MAG TPA: DNA repair protein RadA, partial [Candidatus Blautia faecavium]|nr:DNA repair protein RadA [Candidatus Blautia faecavium]